MSRPPPGPCRVCGNPKHWDRECPRYDIWRSARQRTVNSVETGSDQATEEDNVYNRAYEVLMTQYHSSIYIDRVKLKEGLSADAKVRKASMRAECVRDGSVDAAPDEIGLAFSVTASALPASQTTLTSRRATVEDVEEEEEDPPRDTPAARVYIIEDTRIEVTQEEMDYANGGPGRPDTDDCAVGGNEDAKTPPPTLPPGTPALKLRKKRQKPDGKSASGVSVLSARGHVGNPDNPETDLRLDSCANITLISLEYYRSLPSPPAMRQGMKTRLWQLTDRSAEITGYVTIPIFMSTIDGILIETEAEAYVVPGMAVPILLGEDYHLNYELTIARNVETGAYVHYDGGKHVVPALGAHRRRKAQKHKLVKKFGVEARTVRAAEDYKISPHATRVIALEGYFSEEKEWVLEKSLLANADETFFALPNALFSSRDPCVPITNPTDQPRMIRKGEPIGYIAPAEEFFDTPRDLKQLEELLNQTAKIVTVLDVDLDGLRAQTQKDRETPSREEGSPRPSAAATAMNAEPES
ncbi:hypothetical protein PLICRDRAFT_85138, partial [Plicaturopsis crispa FD-325 SS-3]